MAIRMRAGRWVGDAAVLELRAGRVDRRGIVERCSSVLRTRVKRLEILERVHEKSSGAGSAS